MKRKWITTGVAAMVITGAAWGQAPQSEPATQPTTPISVLLEQGIYQEETAGDLAAAAQTYRQVIERGSSDRKSVAQALYRLGMVCLKQKQTKQAMDAFAQLKAQYMTSLPGAPDAQYVVIQFDTQFENKKDAVETVTPMKETDGKWKVSGYYVK